jgi:four helix bundle protein
MNAIKPHHRLLAWREAMALVRCAYDITEKFPAVETYGLRAQIRRTAISIPSNLAEGAGRAGPREFARFVAIARGSLSELETQLLIAADLGYLQRDYDVFERIDRLSRLFTGLHRKLAVGQSRHF